jgi:hypothetical protein
MLIPHFFTEDHPRNISHHIQVANIKPKSLITIPRRIISGNAKELSSGTRIVGEDYRTKF